MGRGFEPLRGHKRGEVLALHHAFLVYLLVNTKDFFTSSLNSETTS